MIFVERSIRRTFLPLLVKYFQSSLGKPPDAYWILALWAVLGIALVNISLGISLGVSSLLVLPQLFGAQIPDNLPFLALIAWSMMALTAALALVTNRYNYLVASWRAIFVGLMAGCVLAIVSAYPAYFLIFANFGSGFTNIDPSFKRLAIANGFLGILLALAIGPIAVLWGRPQGWQRRFTLGAIAGGLAGIFLFGGSGGVAAGWLAQSPLYEMALADINYTFDQLIFKRLVAFNVTFPWIYGTFWLLIGGGVLGGGLTGLLTPLRRVSSEKTSTAPMPWPPIVLIASFLLFLPILFNLATFSELSGFNPTVFGIIQNVFDNYGFSPRWNPHWNLVMAMGQPWLLMLIVQAFGLYWWQRTPLAKSLHRLAVVVTFLVGFGNFVFGVLLIAMNQSFLLNPWLSPIILVSIFFGFEMLTASWRLWRCKGSINSSSESSIPERPVWAAAGAVVGILAACFSYQFFVVALSITYYTMAEFPIPTNLLPPQNSHGPFLSSQLFDLQFIGLIAFVIQGAIIGTFIGLRLSYWPWRWTLWSSLRSWLDSWRNLIGIDKIGLVVLGIIGALIIPFLLFGLSPTLITIYTAMLSVLVIRRRDITYLPRAVWAPALFVSVVGFLGLTSGWGRLQLANSWLLIIFGLLVGPALGVVYQAMTIYSLNRLWPGLRLTTMFGGALLAGVLIAYVGQESLIVSGGVTRYDGQQWEVFTSDNSSLGGRVNYELFSDKQGNLWFGGGSGVIIDSETQLGQLYQMALPFTTGGFRTDVERAEQLAERILFLDDEDGNIWFARDRDFGQFVPKQKSDNIHQSPYLRIPSRLATNAELEGDLIPRSGFSSFSQATKTRELTEAEAKSGVILVRSSSDFLREEPTFALPAMGWRVNGMSFDSAGDLWLATGGGGVLYLDGGRELDDARWKFFTTENSGLVSDDVRSIYTDQSNHIWFGTTRGLVRFDGTTWKTITTPKLDTNVPVTSFLEDTQNWLWVATAEGGGWWDGQDWTSFDDITGWSGGEGVTTLSEDSRGGHWVGTTSGALRFDGQQWSRLVPNLDVTTFAESPPGVVWIGGKEGLIRYNLVTREQANFDPDNSGLATNWIRDLHVDQEGGLWVSTFSTEWARPSSWWIVGVGLLLFGYVFTNTYRGYARTPETRARRLAQQIMIEPDHLYPVVYELFIHEPDAESVLIQLAEYLAKAGDQTGAEAVTALATLSDNQLDTALQRTVTAFEADSARTWAASLYELHRLLGKVLTANRIPEIIDLELAVNPGQQAGEISVQVLGHSVEVLPPFLAEGEASAWPTLERVYDALRKSHDVDAATDRLGYLAEALAASEAAHMATRSLELPEEVVMATIADQWRTAVTNEISAVSGRAELRLELRTRQVRRTAQVSLLLQLQNTGRATAENIVVMLFPMEEIEPVGETQMRLERLPSGRSTPIEFAISPTDREMVRVVCHVTWNDRVAKDNKIEFADVVRFYEVDEEFHRIPNPYIVGHPVRSTDMFFGRGDVFHYIEDNLSGSVQDRTLVLHGQRRTGKTSILYQLAQGRLGQGFITALIDMQELALLNSTGDFLNEIAYQLARAVRKANVKVEEPPLETFLASPTRAFNRFLDTLEDSLGKQRLVVMIDEFELIENKIAEGKLDANILSYFRSLIQHRSQLVFIFTGTHRLEEMSHDYWSILFNIALYRRVSFLSPIESARLIRQPVADTLDIDDLAVEKISGLTSGHPYFIQLICWALVNHCNAHQRNYATINDVNDAVREILTSGEAHFAYIWQQATAIERLALAGLAHTLQPGKTWARPAEILETLATGGISQTQRATLVETLDSLVAQEIIEVAKEGVLRYRFQIQVLQLWVRISKSIAATVERGQ